MRTRLWVGAAALLVSCGGGSSSNPAPGMAADAASEAAAETGAPDGPADAPDAEPPDVQADTDAAHEPGGEDAADAVLDGDAQAGCADCILQASSVCTPPEGPCSAHPPATAVYASYRKDFYYKQYQEGDLTNPIPAPVNGGRFNITAVANKGGKVTAVRLNGQSTTDLLTAQKMDWAHVYPLVLQQDQAFWVNFHSREASWDGVQSASLEVETEAGLAFTGSFPVAVNQAPLKHVTFTDDYKTVVIHVEPRVQGSAKLTRVLYNGRDVTGSACVPGQPLAGGVDHLITVPLCTAAKPGDAWTVTLVFEGLPASTAGGRVLRDFFPIETWQKESQCPYPMYNTALYEDHVAHGFDTFFTRPDTPTSACGSYGQPTTIHDLVGPEATAHGYHTVVTFEAQSHFLPYTDVSGIAAAFHADECDDALLVNNEPKPQTRAALAKRVWETWPELPTYIGGSRLRYDGAFAGAADIQGFDYYVAACAPHITVAGTHPALRGAFDMLLGVHENHMPHTSWFYTQALHDGWNANLGGVTVYRQPNPAEFRIQALSVLMAGGKGIMYFQTHADLAAMFADTWTEIGAVNRDIRGLRPFLHEADIHRLLQQPDSYVASVLRSRRLMAVILFNLKTTSAPTELQCVTGQNAHWVLGDNTVPVTVDVPADFQVHGIAELRNGAFLPIDYTLSGRDVTFPAVSLSHADAGRIILLMADSGVKPEMLARMSY